MDQDMNWRNVMIEFPPHDGYVLVWVEDNPSRKMHFGRYVNQEWVIDGHAGDWKVTHWAPMIFPYYLMETANGQDDDKTA